MMHLSTRNGFCWLGTTASLLAATVDASPQGAANGCCSDGSTIERDVIVLGGGSGGTYASVRLHAMGKSVVLLEREADLGGNVQTYYDPASNGTMDYGVVLYSNTSVARNYFDYLGVDVIAFEGFAPDGKTLYIDDKTGEELEEPTYGNATAAGEIFYEQLQAYGDLFEAPGYFLPHPVPEDLLLPWGEWLNKYNASATAYDVFYEQAGDALELLTLYVMKYWNQDHFNTNSLTTAGSGNQEIYNTAYAKLGAENVLLNSNVKSITRGDDVVTAEIERACGRQTIKAKQLVIAIRPKYVDLVPFLDIRDNESELTKEFTNLHTWTCILENSGIPANTGVQLVDTSAQGGVPPLPATLGISSSQIPNQDRHAFWWSSHYDIATSEVEASLLETTQFVQQSLNYSSPNGAVPVLTGLKHHQPYLVRVPAESIASGFYHRLNGLQGQYNTWWTGAAWESESSASIWKFTEQVMLPGLMKVLD